MRRLYYLTNDIDRAARIARELERCRVSQRRIHVLSRNEGGLMTRHLHGASYLDRLDIVHRGLQGLVVGLMLGVVLLGMTLWLLERPFEPSAQLALVALTTLFGSWIGGLIGFAYENHRLAAFHDAVELGQHLIMVDVPGRDVERVRSLIEGLNQADYVGENFRLAL